MAKITIEEINHRLEIAHNNTVSIDESTYAMMSKMARFIDIDFGEWWCIANKVINFKSRHPSRGEQIRIAKIRESHARPEFRKDMSDTIKAKMSQIQKTNIEKYGVISALVLPENKAKSITAIKAIAATEEAIERSKTTKAAAALRRQEARLIGKSKYPAERKANSIKQRNESMQDNGSFYNLEGLTLKDFWNEHCKEDISYTYMCKMYSKHLPKTILEFTSIIKDMDNMSDIELAMSSNSNLTRFDKYPYKYANFRPDFKVSDSLYVNVDGLYWHSDSILDNDYHIKLRQKAENANINILQFRADEVIYKRPIVDSMINVKAGIACKKYARKLSIETIDVTEARVFLSENHLMGFCGATKHIALKDKDTQSLLSINISGSTGKIIRFCGALHTVTVGGYSRLLKHAIKEYNLKEIITFVDLRYGGVSALENIGFKHVGTTLGWKWTDYDKTYNRRMCRANMDDRKLTQAEHAKELKLHKIYDAGQAKMIWRSDGK